MIKCSELIVSLAQTIKEYGDVEVKLGILTENGDWQYSLDNAHIGIWDGNANKNPYKYYEVTLEIKNVKEFKKEIK